jgi:tetratricopeptide (TPR) repeat protein
VKKRKGAKGALTDLRDAAVKLIRLSAAALKDKGIKGVLTDLRDVAVKLVQLSAAALLIVVLYFLFRWALSPAPGITVLPFGNNTGSPDYDAMGKGIAASLITELHDIRRIHMIKARGPEKVMTMRAGDIAIMGGEGALPIIREPIMPGEVMRGEGAVEKSLKEIGAISAGEVNVPVGSLLATVKTLFSGSGKTISGSIQKYGSTILIVARLDENGTKIKAWEVSGPASSGSELTALIEELAFKMCWDLSENVAAKSWESFKHFTYGLENSHRYELSEGAEDAYAYKAIRNYEDAIAIQPGYAIAHYNLGAIYYHLGQCSDGEGYHKARCERAIGEYKKAIEANPAFKDAYYNLGVAYHIAFFDREMAMENYSRVINLDSNYSEAYRNRGVIYVEREEYEEAINDFSHLIDLKPKDAEAYLPLGLTYKKKASSEQSEQAESDLNRAIENFSQAIDLDPNLTEAYYNRGCAHIDLEQYDKAVIDLSQAITLELSYVEAYSARGLAYSAQDEHGKAVNDFSQAIALDPANPQAYNSRAMAYRCLGDTKTPTEAVEYYDKAIADYTMAIGLDRTVSSFYYDRGLCRKSLWNLPETEKAEQEAAIQDFKEFLKREEDPHWRVMAGDELRELQGKETIAELDREIQDKPDNAEAFYERGIAYFDVEVYKQAIADFNQFIELKPEDAQAYLQLGIAYTKLDPPQEEKAIADFERVIEINPEEAGAYFQRGLIYERQAQVHDKAEQFQEANIAYTKAITDFGQVISIDHQNRQAYRHRGEDHYRMGQIYAHISADPGEAQDRFHLAVNDLTDFIELTTAITDTDVVWARNLRGLSYFESGQYDLAITDFTNAIELQPDPFSYYNRGNAYYKLPEYQKAITDYSKAIELDPNIADFYYKRGSAHESVWKKEMEARPDRDYEFAWKKEMETRRRREMAIQDLEKAARLGYDVPEEQLRGLREGEKSIAELDQIIAKDPEKADAYYYYLRGVARAGQGQCQPAINDFTRVIELQPDHAEALYNRGLVYAHLDQCQEANQYQEAVDDFTAAIKLGIEGIEMLYRHRGQTYLALGNSVKAIADFGRVIDLKSSDAEAYRLRGTVYSDLGDYDQAITDFNQAIRLNPTDVEAHYHLGMTYIELGDYSQAFANFDRAIEINPLNAKAYNGLGIAHTNLEDYPQAIAYLNRAIKLDPAYAEAYYNRGIAHKLQGNNKKATQDFESAKKKDPYWQGLAENQLEELQEQ